ncbi:uncharacterized protein NPIL_632421 [Nephila pilipes]|uniref:Uncharacterized protein n=1 Tax=Nephila pilipes TaxID=299642 RepID=A0A8X6K2F7_NEPPI|nr:uncharacterized protein NPIL_594131 [Nephila pilipes]GFT36070.1 uncharacterized protein NPIL_632421 [Nephila pilipes]
MKLRFWPPLQLIAQVRIARGILCNLEFENNFPDFMQGVGLIDLEYMHQILSSLNLETVLKNSTMGVIEVLVKEIANWCSCHRSFLIEDNLDYWNILQWYSHGTINRLETARALIQDKNINIGQRFNLACAYYMEADVRRLWKNMSPGYRHFFTLTKLNSEFRMFWINALQTNTPLDWNAISLSLMSNNIFKDNSSSFFYIDFLGVLQLIPKLEDSNTRFMTIVDSIGKIELHPFDFYLCLSQMEDHQLHLMFNCLLMDERLCVCKSFLHWPLQVLFLDVLAQLSRSMSEVFYIELFQIILNEKFNTEWFDYNYVDLVKKIWSSLSDYIKCKVKQGRIFPCLKRVLDCYGGTEVCSS